jgi:hypothetical protein
MLPPPGTMRKPPRIQEYHAFIAGLLSWIAR